MFTFLRPVAALVLLALLPAAGLRAQPSLKARQRVVVAPPARPDRFQLYLLVGQSNMAGRGTVAAEDTVPNRRVLALNKANQWEIAKDPLHFDKPGVGVGPGLTFGRAMAAAADTSVTIGLIPCAVGGTSINYWQFGAYFADTKTRPYTDALLRARAAMAHGQLAGIIWNQGESDTSPELSVGYQKKLVALVERFRTDLDAPDLPFVAGLLPGFQVVRVSESGEETTSVSATRINEAIQTVQQMLPNYAVVQLKESQHRGDKIHYDAASARRLGQQYAEAMLKLQKKARKKSR